METKVTEKEYKFLVMIEQDWQSQESDDGSLSAFVCDDSELDMKVARGLMGSLVVKGIITEELYEEGVNAESNVVWNQNGVQVLQ